MLRTNDLSLIEKSGEISHSEAKVFSAQREAYGISDWDMQDIGLFLDEIFRTIIDKNVETNVQYRGVLNSPKWEENLLNMQGLGYAIFSKNTSLDDIFDIDTANQTIQDIANLRKEFYQFIFDHIEELNLL